MESSPVHLLFLLGYCLAVIEGELRCHCTESGCVSTGYMCKSRAGQCFTSLETRGEETHLTHGCVDSLPQHHRERCQLAAADPGTGTGTSSSSISLSSPTSGAGAEQTGSSGKRSASGKDDGVGSEKEEALGLPSASESSSSSSSSGSGSGNGGGSSSSSGSNLSAGLHHHQHHQKLQQQPQQKLHPPAPILVCCTEDMCNYGEGQDVTFNMIPKQLNVSSYHRGNAPPASETSVYARDHLASARRRHTSREDADRDLWFKAAVIAVPIAGGFILVLLVLLAVRMLRHDSTRHRRLIQIHRERSLTKAHMYISDHFAGRHSYPPAAGGGGSKLQHCSSLFDQRSDRYSSVPSSASKLQYCSSLLGQRLDPSVTKLQYCSSSVLEEKPYSPVFKQQQQKQLSSTVPPATNSELQHFPHLFDEKPCKGRYSGVSDNSPNIGNPRENGVAGGGGFVNNKDNFANNTANNISYAAVGSSSSNNNISTKAVYSFPHCSDTSPCCGGVCSAQRENPATFVCQTCGCDKRHSRGSSGCNNNSSSSNNCYNNNSSSKTCHPSPATQCNAGVDGSTFGDIRNSFAPCPKSDDMSNSNGISSAVGVPHTLTHDRPPHPSREQGTRSSPCSFLPHSNSSNHVGYASTKDVHPKQDKARRSASPRTCDHYSVGESSQPLLLQHQQQQQQQQQQQPHQLHKPQLPQQHHHHHHHQQQQQRALVATLDNTNSRAPAALV